MIESVKIHQIKTVLKKYDNEDKKDLSIEHRYFKSKRTIDKIREIIYPSTSNRKE